MAWINTATGEIECGTIWALLKVELIDLADGFISSKLWSLGERLGLKSYEIMRSRGSPWE